MDTRELKALELAARTRIVWEGDVCHVPSQTGKGRYKVERKADGLTCTCEDFALRQKPCKHVLAAQFVLERAGGDQAPAVDTDAVPVRKTYKQAWTAYNLAQTTEKHRLQVLLHELCQGIPQPPRQGVGRHPVPYADAVFAAAFKVYSTFSCRRFMCDLNDAHAKGYLSRPIHYNRISAYLDNPELTPILQALIAESSRPLQSVEVDFACDSSGFTTSRFVKWYDHKYGAVRQEHDWVKVHLLCGVRTNVITAVTIEDRNAGDAPQFAGLVNATAQTFTIREVSGDKAYSSVENLAVVAGHGGTAYIPFKANATGGKGGLWGKMFHYYSFNREEFLAHYHRRSNVESTFSMLKAKFRDHVRSKTDTAMKNEVLCKILCHNLCVVIQSQCELGIEATFWPEEPTERADILPMARRG